MLVGLLLLVAAAGKSGLVPFCGWLPRAMEGPTPSSAIFYGALSVHLGAFLLLRVSPLLECSPALCAVIVVLGLTTAGLAYLIGSVQTDIKSVLSFASLSQVGIIVAEIGLGFRYLALVHLLGHACLRTLQFLRAPSLLHDYHGLENALGKHLPRPMLPLLRRAGPAAVPGSIVLALERGHLDSWLTICFVTPFVALFRRCDALERALDDWLLGVRRKRTPEHKPAPPCSHGRTGMIPLPLPWLEAAILIALLGAAFISRVRNLDRAWRWAVAFTGACPGLHHAGLARLLFAGIDRAKTAPSHGACKLYLFGRPYLGLDELNAPLVPAAALLHFLTAVATARTKMRRFSLTWSLCAEVFHLAKFACTDPIVLIGLLDARSDPAACGIYQSQSADASFMCCI